MRSKGLAALGWKESFAGLFKVPIECAKRPRDFAQRRRSDLCSTNGGCCTNECASNCDLSPAARCFQLGWP